MKKWQKFVLLIMSFNILFFAVDSKKREAEAFVVTTSMVALGALAIVAAGGVMYSTGLAERIGQNIKLNVPTVDDSVTSGFGGLKINMTPAIQLAMSQAVLQERASLESYQGSSSRIERMEFGRLSKVPLGYLSASVGETIRVEIENLEVVGSYNGVNAFDIENKGSSYTIANSVRLAVGTYENVVLEYLLIRPSYDLVLAPKYTAIAQGVTFYKVPSPAIQQELNSLGALPNTYDSINGAINSNLAAGKSYVVNNTHSIEGATNLKELESGIGAVNESVGTSNNWLSNIYSTLTTFVTSIPAATAAFFKPMFDTINNTMTGLWEDAGLVWSGIKDAVNATNTWLNNVLAGALDGLSNGIDNLARVFQDTWAGIEAGLAAIGQNVLALPQTLLDDLTEIKTAVTALAIPTALDMSTYTNKMDELRQKMASKFEFITLPIQQIKAVFASPKSLYDVKFTILKQDVYVLPRMFEPVVNITKNVLTGAAVISTFISIYRRFTPKEVIA